MTKKIKKNPKAERGQEIVGSLPCRSGIPREVILDACHQLFLSLAALGGESF